MAAITMGSILIDYARARSAGERGGGQTELSLEESLVFAEGRSGDLLALDEALKKLAASAPRDSETAEVFQVCANSAKCDGGHGKDWLHDQIRLEEE